jgi:hypothetical protein
MPSPLRPSTPTALAFVAIVLSLTGSAGAALITSTGIATNAIQSKHIKAGAVTTSDLANRAVTNAKLASGAVKGATVANESLTGDDVLDASITARDLAPGLIGAAALADGSVSGSKLATASVDSTILATGAVTGSDLADGAVSTAKLVDGAITTAKLGDLQVTSGKLADGAVTGAKLGTSIAAAVTAANVTIARGSFDGFPADETDGDVVSFTAEEFDTAAVHDNVTNPTRLTPGVAGLYDVSAWVSWAADGSGYRSAQILVNGSTIAAMDRTTSTAGNLMQRPNQNVQALVSLDADDYVQLRIAHYASVASLDADRVRVTIRRVGAL